MKIGGLLLLFCFCCGIPLRAQLPGNDDLHTVLSYSGGWFAPFGIRVAEEAPSGFAGYLTARCNLPAFTADKYVIRNGRIDDAEWIWSYAGKKKYARAEFYLGFQLPIIKPQEMPVINQKIGLTFWASGGMLYARYLYLFNRMNSSGDEAQFWIRDLDLGGVGFDMEAGVAMRMGPWRFHFGNSGFFHRTEPMFVAGFGWLMQE